MTQYFDCEIQARLRDLNIGGHLDNVEALRVIDEARLLFLRHAVLTPDGEPTGLYRDLPDGIGDLAGGHRIDYRSEIGFAPERPFLVRMWVGHIGRTSFTVCAELRLTPGSEPAIVAETTLALRDFAAGASWPISDDVRRTLASYVGPPVALRERPGS